MITLSATGYYWGEYSGLVLSRSESIEPLKKIKFNFIVDDSTPDILLA